MSNKNKSLILFSKYSQKMAAFKLHDKLLRMAKTPLIFSACDEAIDEKGYSIRDLSYYQEIFKINHSTIKEESDKIFYSLTNFMHLTEYKSVSLWELSAHYALAEITYLLYYINMINSIINLEEITEICLIEEGGNLEKIAKIICAEKHIPCFVYRKNSIVFLWVYKISDKFLFFLREIKKAAVSFYFLASNFRKCIKKSYSVIFFSPLERFLVAMLPVIMKYSENERLVINTYQSGCSERFKESNISFTDFYGYKLYNPLSLKTRILLKKISIATCKNTKFFSNINYLNFPIGSFIADIFKKAVYSEFPEKIREVDTIRKIISYHKPKVVIVRDCAFNIYLIMKSLSVPVVAMQISNVSEFIVFGPVKADAITVEGGYWKEYLTKRSFDPSKIWVTGSPQFDVLGIPRLRQADNSYLPLKFDKSKKVVVFTTSYSSLFCGMLEYERRNRLSYVFRAAKNIKDLHLIIKLHPFEKDEANIYKKIAQETGLSEYNIIRNANNLVLLENCDLLISYFSTTSYEAVLMNKNVILLSHDSAFSTEDSWDFERYGVVTVVKDFNKLEDYIRAALFDSVTIQKLASRRKEYILDHAYKLDGRAADRIKEVIDQFLIK